MKRPLPRKVLVYLSILAGEVSLLLLVSGLFGISTENTWLGAIGASVLNITLCVMLVHFAGTLLKTRAVIGCFLYFTAIVLFIALVVTNVVFFSR